MGSTKKVYVEANKSVTFICLNCGEVRKDQADLYADKKGLVNIQCTCGNAYDVEIEFRSLYRKETRLDGIYLNAANPKNWGKILVKDLSIKGCKFETLMPNLLRTEDEINIEFRLNNTKNSLIKKRAIIRHVNKNQIGCEFKELPGSTDPDLGFYLMKI